MLLRHLKPFKPAVSRLLSSQSQSLPGTLNNELVRNYKFELYEEERKRQLNLIPRLEKINVEVKSSLECATVVMNKHISTPYMCTMHIHQSLMQNSVLAMVDGKPWDMHRPLEDDCTLEFKHFKSPDTKDVNKAFWKSCSFILGLLAEKAFKDSLFVELHSWPSVSVKSGSFVYDMDLKLPDWKPTSEELNTFTTMARRLCSRNLQFQRLEVDASVALKVFKHNKYKLKQIPLIAAKSATGNTVTLYCVDSHVDISNGPMISNLNHIGRFELAAVHQIGEKLHRMQGVALPAQLPLNHYAWSILKSRAEKLNPHPVLEISTPA